MFTRSVLLIVAICLSTVYGFFNAEERESIHKAVAPIVTSCAEETGVTQDEIDAAQKVHNEETLNPCFLSCAYKKAGILDEQGKYNADTGMNVVKDHMKEDRFNEIVAKAKKCGSVNDKAVSDGAAGCDRAALVLSCWKEQGIQIAL